MTPDVGQRLAEKSRPLEFKKSMGLFGATSLGIGSLMGAGLYVLVGIAAKEAGPGLFVAYGACGLLTLFSVGMYSDLSRRIPVSGGGYVYAYKRLGSFWGFIVGWHLAIGSIFACALYAYGFGSYLEPFLKFEASNDFIIRGIAIALVALLVLLSLRGGEGGSRLQSVLTWSNVGVVLFLIVIATLCIEGAHYTPMFPNGVGGVGGAISLVYLSFFGYQLIANAAEEVEQPERIVPRAMGLSLVIAFILYVAVAVVALGAVRWTELSDSAAPLVLVASRAVGPAGGVIIGVGALLASIAALNGTLISQARQIFAMGRDRFIPAPLGTLSEKTRVPALALLAGGAVTGAVLLLADLAFIAKAANFSLLFSMLPLSFALHGLNRERQAAGERLSWFRRALPFLALVSNAGLLLTLDAQSLMFGGTIVGVGCVVFFAYSHSSEKRGQAGYSVNLGEDRSFHLLGQRKRILVPMANPKTLPLLLTLAGRLQSKRGDILVLNIVPTKEGQQPREALSRESQVFDAVTVLSLADAVAKANQVEFTPIVRAARKLSDGIVDAAVEEHADLIVMGWSENQEAMASRLLDHVAEEWRGNLMLYHAKNGEGDQPETRFRRIGVALGGPGNLALMVRTAGALVSQSDGKVTYFNVLPHFYDLEEMARAREIQLGAIQKHQSQVPYATDLLQSDNPLETIIRQSESLDLLIVGASNAHGAFGGEHIGSFTAMVARDARCPVIIVRQERRLASIIPPPVEALR